MADKENKLDEALEAADQILNEDKDFLDEFGGGADTTAARKAVSARDTDQDRDPNRDLEDMSPAELHEEIQKEKKKAARSLVFALTALIAIIAICIAWFVANNVIKGGAGDVSAGMDTTYELASVGVRQQVEESYYWNTAPDDKILAAGTKKSYDSYFDIESHTVKNTVQEYNIGDNNIAWYQDGQTVVEPGASGKLEFYVIPKDAGHKTMTITLKVEAYTLTHSSIYREGEDEITADSRAVRVDKEIVQNLVDGHILLFRGLDSNGYSGWIPVTQVDTGDIVSGDYGNVFSISAEDIGISEFEKDTPYKVTVYWVWPKYFRNYIYASRTQNGDLFSDISEENSDHTALIEFINKQKVMGITGGSKLFYYGEDAQDVEQNVTDAGIDSNMTGELLNKCSRYYNLADEYIGNNARLMYVNATVE